MITYLKMKHAEHKIKLAFFSSILGIMKNQNDILEFCKKIYDVTKDVPNDEFQNAIVSAIASLVHEENSSKN